MIPLDPGTIHVWCGSLDLRAALVSDSALLLSPEERDRAAQLIFSSDYRCFVAAHAMLRQVLGAYLGVDPIALLFDVGPHGKPTLRVRPSEDPLHFNLSHSGETALLAVSRNGPVGIDIEQICPEIVTWSLVQAVCVQSEIEQFSALPEALLPRAFFNCWTRKEAYLKGIGEGLTVSLKNIEVSLDPRLPASLLRAPTGNSWSIHDLDMGPQACAAVAANQPNARRVLIEWDAETFAHGASLPGR